MISLRDLQQQFYDAALHGRADGIAASVCGNGMRPAERLRIYQNNASEAFRKNLAAAYPVIQRLVGDRCFAALARDYMRARPSHSGDLQHFGRHLARFIAGRYANSVYAYLADVARLEWAIQQVLAAGPEPALDPQTLATVPPDEVAGICLRMVDGSRLVGSDYPVLDIWKANQPGADPAQVVDLSGGRQDVLVCKRPAQVELRLLAGAQMALLRTLKNAGSLGMALDAALAVQPDFVLDSSLAVFFRLGLFSAGPC